MRIDFRVVDEATTVMRRDVVERQISLFCAQPLRVDSHTLDIESGGAAY